LQCSGSRGIYLDLQFPTTATSGDGPGSSYDPRSIIALDNQIRLPGIANWDLALFEDTHLAEKVVFAFRVESFNLFNRVQFGGYRK